MLELFMGENDSEQFSVKKFFSELMCPVDKNEIRQYSFDRLWGQRHKLGAKPLEIESETPSTGPICLGFREYKEPYGKHFYVLGIFENVNDKYKPIGYLFADRSGHESSLISNTADKSQFEQFRHDPVFSSLTDSIHGGMSFVVGDSFQEHGLGTKMIETMLDVSEKINALELIFNNVSGELHRLCETLAQQGKISFRYVESTGTWYIKRKAPGDTSL